jgi:uncharacterized protein YjaG (DUF416 family)
VKKSTNRKKALLISITPFVFTRPALEMKQAKKKNSEQNKKQNEQIQPENTSLLLPRRES